MSATLYMAVAICIGTPADEVLDKNGEYLGRMLGNCDYGMWEDAGPDGKGFTESTCADRLKLMKERGNVVKFCLPNGQEITSFQIEWSKEFKP